jgi:probable addiction module antidote protein
VVTELMELITEVRVQMIGPVRQELLSGIKSRVQFQKLCSSLRAFPDLELTPCDYESAAESFNFLRSKKTQGPNTDFLLCAIALRHKIPIFNPSGAKDMKHMTDYESDLHEWLKSPGNAAAYLNAVLEEGDKSAMLLALREVAQANGGMAAIAEKAHVKRESLYQMLSKRGNPELTSLFNVLHGMGLTITIQPMQEVEA